MYCLLEGFNKYDKWMNIEEKHYITGINNPPTFDDFFFWLEVIEIHMNLKANCKIPEPLSLTVLSRKSKM